MWWIKVKATKFPFTHAVTELYHLSWPQNTCCYSSYQSLTIRKMISRNSKLIGTVERPQRRIISRSCVSSLNSWQSNEARSWLLDALLLLLLFCGVFFIPCLHFIWSQICISKVIECFMIKKNYSTYLKIEKFKPYEGLYLPWEDVEFHILSFLVNAVSKEIMDLFF